jgi:hypothetical protein
MIRLGMIFLYVTILLSFSTLNAQTCFGTELKIGSGYEMASYNAKGKLQGKNVFTFKDIKKDGNSTIISVEMEAFNSKGKPESKNAYTIQCDGDKFIVDGQALINPEQLKSMEAYDMTFTGKGLERPKNISVGQSLPNSSIKGRGSASSLDVSMDLNITNRKVESKEKITVAAGSYEAFKIPSDVAIKMVTIIPITFEYQVISYVSANEIWDLKTETYRKGKMVGYSELVRVF